MPKTFPVITTLTRLYEVLGRGKGNEKSLLVRASHLPYPIIYAVVTDSFPWQMVKSWPSGYGDGLWILGSNVSCLRCLSSLNGPFFKFF